MSANPLDIYRQFDPKVIASFENLQDLALSEGVLSQKSRLLIAMAIDVEHGALQGAAALGRRAMKLGVTREEIVEVLRVAYYVGGNRALFSSANSCRTSLSDTWSFLRLPLVRTRGAHRRWKG